MTPERQREQWRTARRNYRAKHKDRCTRCARAERIARSTKCSICLARLLEERLPGFEHDTEFHAEMLLRARCQDSECAASGLTLAQLVTVGERLEVDRIDPHRGYVRGNCQLLAACLNRSKWRHDSPAEWDVDALQRQVHAPRNPEADALRGVFS